MFGCIAAGRLVQTNLNQVDVNKYVFELDRPHTINHIIVFLLGTIPFEPGFAATVHLQWPNKAWQLLGEISNEKPSAIFRLRNASNVESQEHVMPATLGISIEPIDSVKLQLQQLPTAPTSTALVKPTTNLSQAAELATRILQNLHNYVYSFLVKDLPLNAIPLANIIDNGYVPVKAFQTWYDSLSKKIANDPEYLAENKSA